VGCAFDDRTSRQPSSDQVAAPEPDLEREPWRYHISSCMNCTIPQILTRTVAKSRKHAIFLGEVLRRLSEASCAFD